MLFLCFQVLILDNDGMVLFDVATPFVFLLFLLMLPFDIPILLMYVVAFSSGLLLDVLSDASGLGLQAFACLAAVGLRNRVAALISASNFRSLSEMNIREQSSIWFVTYLFPLIFVHQFAWHFLEAMQFSLFFTVLWRAICSSLYSFVFCYILAFLFYKK